MHTTPQQAGAWLALGPQLHDRTPWASIPPTPQLGGSCHPPPTWPQLGSGFPRVCGLCAAAGTHSIVQRAVELHGLPAQGARFGGESHGLLPDTWDLCVQPHPSPAGTGKMRAGSAPLPQTHRPVYTRAHPVCLYTHTQTHTACVRTHAAGLYCSPSTITLALFYLSSRQTQSSKGPSVSLLRSGVWSPASGLGVQLRGEPCPRMLKGLAPTPNTRKPTVSEP